MYLKFLKSNIMQEGADEILVLTDNYFIKAVIFFLGEKYTLNL